MKSQQYSPVPKQAAAGRAVLQASFDDDKMFLGLHKEASSLVLPPPIEVIITASDERKTDEAGTLGPNLNYSQDKNAVPVLPGQNQHDERNKRPNRFAGASTAQKMDNSDSGRNRLEKKGKGEHKVESLSASLLRESRQAPPLDPRARVTPSKVVVVPQTSPNNHGSLQTSWQAEKFMS